MAYQSGDDPQLLSDLRNALKGWHRPTLGDAALAATGRSQEAGEVRTRAARLATLEHTGGPRRRARGVARPGRGGRPRRRR